MKSLREFENLHIALWLMKDTCWVLTLKALGLFMIAPTLGVAIYIAVRSRKDRDDFVHNLAVCSWITANSVWMIGEFYFEDTIRWFAFIFFAIGLALVAYYYLFLFRKRNKSYPTVVD